MQQYDLQTDPRLTRDLGPELTVRRFVDDYLQLGMYLAKTGRFAPTRSMDAAVQPRPPAPAPRYISHRGNTRGPDDPRGDNTRAALEAAVRAGFEWVEIDLQITRDGQVVLAHDAQVVTEDGTAHVIGALDLDALLRVKPLPTLEEVLRDFAPRIGLALELKPQKMVFQGYQLAHQVLRAISRYPQARGFVIDSFNPELIATIAKHSELEVGYDLPIKPVREAWLDYAQRAGFDWVYVDRQHATTEAIEAAHRHGLRICVYGINDADALAPLRGAGPDAIITDVAGWWRTPPATGDPRNKPN